MTILCKAPILAALTIGICMPLPALAYLSPEAVFDIELPEETPAESLPSLEETAAPPANETGTVSDENDGQPVDIAEPLADPDGTAKDQPAEEETLLVENMTDDEGVDPNALIEALQAAERQAEITEEEMMEEGIVAEEETAPSAREGVLFGIGGIALIGIVAVVGALGLGAFILVHIIRDRRITETAK